jgi:hypothetical protein
MNNFEIETFILGSFINKNLCDDLINFFKQNESFHTEGQIVNKNKGVIIDHNVKQSTDMSFDYKNCIIYPIDEYVKQLNIVIEEYKSKYEVLQDYDSFHIVETFNIQKYIAGGGFKTWHSERLNKKTLNRQFVFMTYLNDVENGGTEFKYQNMKMEAKKGLTLIWPSDWTHTHRGVVANKEKYIITGWLGFKENE